MTDKRDIRGSVERLGQEVASLPLAAAIQAATTDPTYLVGGAVRDLLFGSEALDLDFAVDGPLDPVIAALGGDATVHERFETASIQLTDGVVVDLARTRREAYPHPGAMPETSPAPIETDLARRDFSVNAMAVPLASPDHLLDPFDGVSDLEMGCLRTLHPDSFRDDPTRALRGARYSARLGLDPTPETSRQLSDLDLSSVSEQRIGFEILLCAEEECGFGALSKAVDWGILETPGRRRDLLSRICRIAESDPWRSYLDSTSVSTTDVLSQSVTVSSKGEPESFRRLEELIDADPKSGSEIAELVSGEAPQILVAARAEGAIWLDRWCEELRSIGLEIKGDDLLAAGVEPGPLIGLGLAAALSARMDGLAGGSEAELAVALAASRSASGKAF